jgi:hypothetical protein
MLELIRVAIERWAGASGVATRTQTKRMAHLETIFGPGAYRIIPRSSGARLPAPRAEVLIRSYREDDDGVEPGLSCLSPASTIGPEPPASALAEGEGRIDYAPMPFRGVVAAGDEDSRGVGARRNRWCADHATIARLGFLHDASTAQVFEYADVYTQWFLRPLDSARSEYVVGALYWGLVMLHGLDPDMLASLQVGTEPREDGLVLDVEVGVLWMPLPRVGYTGTLSPASAVVSRAGSELASVPMLPWLHGLARRLRPDEGCLIFGAWITAEQDVGTKQLAARLVRSTRRWLQHHGLPAVIADLVAGRFSFSTLATSAYLNLSTQTARSVIRRFWRRPRYVHGM